MKILGKLRQSEESPFPPPGTDGRFGLELTFTNSGMVEAARDEREADYGSLFEQHLAAWLVAIRQVAPEARVESRGKDLWDYSKVSNVIIWLDHIKFITWCQSIFIQPENALQISFFIHGLHVYLFRFV